MKFKRLATMLMAAAMMVSLVACAGDNGENSETPVSSGNDVVEETEANHITLAESWGFENFGYWNFVVDRVMLNIHFHLPSFLF